MATKTVQAAEAATEAITQAVARVAKTKAPSFKKPLGKKQIFLPNFTITMIRNNVLPPTFASFIVPLNLNKLDLRDYLWNMYGVPVIAVRSYIQLQKLRQDSPHAIRPAPRRWYRPRSIKKMTVELATPFVWPEEPTEDLLEGWDKTMFDRVTKFNAEGQDAFRPDARQKPRKDRASLREQALEMLSGDEKWSPTARKFDWEDVGDAVEVETNVDLAAAEEPETGVDSPEAKR